jgi:ADP-heptose:LPS heptosyltransferase
VSLPQLAAVIKHSALHFCGDTGPLHLAAMTNTPTVTWFWPNPGLRQWVPTGDQFRIVMGQNEPGESYLRQIDTAELVRAAQSVLAGASGNT